KSATRCRIGSEALRTSDPERSTHATGRAKAAFLVKSVLVLVAAFLPISLGATERRTISLDGMWDIEDSRDAEAIPSVWKRKAPVPGLAHSAQPAFPQVDQFDSRMLIQNRVRDGKLPKSAIVYNAGVSRQERNWSWYQQGAVRNRGVAQRRQDWRPPALLHCSSVKCQQGHSSRSERGDRARWRASRSFAAHRFRRN